MENLENKSKEQLLEDINKLNESKEKDKTIKESEKLLKTIAENYPNSYLSIINKDYTIGFSSGQEFKKQNLNPDDFIGLTIEQVFGEHTETVREYYIKTFNGEECRFELFINNQFQHYKTVPIYAIDGSIQQILVFVENITEQKNIVNNIKESQRLLDKVGEIAKIGGWEMDLTKDGAAKWTKATYDIIELNQDEAVPGFKEHIDYYFPEYREMIRKKMNDIVETAKPLQFIAKAKTKKGKIIWVEAMGEAVLKDDKVVKLRGTLQDITERKQAEIELIKEKNKAQQYLDIAEVILVSIDSEGIVQLINPKGCEVLGYTKDEIIGKNWFDTFIPERLRKQVKAVAKKVLSGDMESAKYYENEIITKSGEEKIIAWNNALLKDESGNIIGTLSSGEDITQRIESENKIKESEQLLTNAIDHAAIGMCMLNIDGSFTNVNKAFCEMFGYSEKELQKMNFQQITYPEDYEVGIDAIKGMLNNEKGRVVIDKRYLHKDGHIIYTNVSSTVLRDENGNPTFFFSQIQDITERKQAEEKIKRFSRIFEDSLNEIFLFDAETLKFTQVNKAAQKNLGYSMEELSELTPLDIKPEFTPELYNEIIAPLRKGEQEKIVFETVHQRKDKSLYNIEIHLQYLKHEQQNLFAAIIIDISERKKAENTLRENELKLRKLLNNIDAGVVIHAPDTLIISSNQRASELLGLSEEQMQGKQAIDPDWKFINENNIPFSLENYPVNKIISNKKPIKNMLIGVIRPITNDIVWLLVNGFPILDNHDKLLEVVISFIDITELKQTEEELQKTLEREQLQADIVRTTPVAIAFGYPDGRLGNCNKAFSDLTGYTEEELKAINWNETLTPAKWNNIEAEELQKLSPKNNSIRYEKEYINKSGRTIPIELIVTAKYDDKNNLIHFIGFITDITERKQAEIALIESEEKFKKLFQSTPLALVNVNKDGVFTLRNDRFIELFGYTDADVHDINDWWLNAYPNENYREWVIKNWESAVQKASKTGDDIKSDEYLVTCKDGSVRNVIISGVTLDDNLLATLNDITERKKADKELAKHRDHLEELVKERTADLETKNKKLDDMMKVFVGRELTIRDLQNKLKALGGK